MMLGEPALRRFVVGIPWLYEPARRGWALCRQVQRELRTLIFVGPKAIAVRFMPRGSSWRRALPVQALHRYRIRALLPMDDLAELKRWLDPGDYAEGRDALYL